MVESLPDELLRMVLFVAAAYPTAVPLCLMTCTRLLHLIDRDVRRQVANSTLQLNQQAEQTSSRPAGERVEE